MNGVKYDDIRAIVEFMYKGEVKVSLFVIWLSPMLGLNVLLFLFKIKMLGVIENVTISFLP